MKLDNKVVWLIGASSGIGEALAYELAKYNCKLVISARREKELIRVKNNIEHKDVFVLPIDLEKHEKSTQWVQEIIDKYDRIDILINNGGIGQKSLAIDTLPEVEKKIMDINYFGNVALSKAVLPQMIKQNSGKIVVTTSILGKFGLPQLSTYAASKHALYGYYDSLRLEVEQYNINIQLISPGFVNTNVTFNSLTADGSKLNTNSDAQENGMSTDIFAKKFVTTLMGNKKHKYIGKKELLSIPFKTFAPNIFYKLMNKMSNKKQNNS